MNPPTSPRRLLARRRFSLDDQRRFATLSGDFNPIHVDPVLARRTLLGEPIVHGMHLALWALEHGLGEDAGHTLVRLRASFPQPTYLERDCELTAEDDTHLRVAGFDGAALELELGYGDAATPSVEPAAGTWPSEEPHEVPRDALPAQRGALPLRYDRDAVAESFPRLARLLPAVTLAELFAATRLVGMRVPGLHSLFTGFELTRHETPAGTPAELRFSVERANLKYSLLSLSVSGPSLTGTLEAFARPAPRASVSMHEVRQKVEASEFESVDALVVGGTRGIGEALAKAICAGGGRAVVTYHRGADDAARVCSEIRDAGGSAVPLAFDVLAPAPLTDVWPVTWHPSYVFYLATPFIRVDRRRVFDATAFELLARYYVSGLHATLEACRALSREPLVCWAPSTAFLDTKEPGTAAYCAAKAAMEELARRLSSEGALRVVTPRLARTRTDQTASLTHDAAADALSVALGELRALTRSVVP